jgi:hypothetical protein
MVLLAGQVVACKLVDATLQRTTGVAARLLLNSQYQKRGA